MRRFKRLNDYQTYREWQAGQDGLFTRVQYVMELPFFEKYTALELDDLFLDMYGERTISKAYRDKTTTEVAIQLVLRFSHKWNELFEWFMLEHPFNASSVETYSETINDNTINTSDGETTNLDSAYNTDEFVNSDKSTNLNTTQTENERTREHTRTRESLQAMTIRRSMISKEVFVDNIFQDTITMICLMVY